MHPRGHEVVICTEGELTLVQQIDGREVRTTLRPGEYAINEPGVWHTADVSGRATAVFITAGAGTEARPRTRSSATRGPRTGRTGPTSPL